MAASTHKHSSDSANRLGLGLLLSLSKDISSATLVDTKVFILSRLYMFEGTWMNIFPQWMNTPLSLSQKEQPSYLTYTLMNNPVADTNSALLKLNQKSCVHLHNASSLLCSENQYNNFQSSVWWCLGFATLPGQFVWVWGKAPVTAGLVEIGMGDLYSLRRDSYFFCKALAISRWSAVPSRLFVFKQWEPKCG